MIWIDNTEVFGFQAAIRGMRNPMNSWSKSDSSFDDIVSVGENDRELMTKLAKAGTEHAKYLRFIDVTCDIVAPLYWWKEFSTYRAGVEKNSCSTMHKLQSKEITLDDFSRDHLDRNSTKLLESIIRTLNMYRLEYNDKHRKEDWWQMIQLLPSSYNQRRTVKMSYQALANMYRQRKGHKLDEWHLFRKWVECLPYSELITMDAEAEDHD